MVKKLLFPLVAIILLIPWPVAYAYDNTMAGTEPVQIVIVESSAMPKMAAFGNAIGGITEPGGLFYIDATGESIDISATLFLTNADELSHNYRYLTLKVGVYAQDGVGQWEPATDSRGELIPDTYLTMRNGLVEFTLPGCAEYKITIDSGCYYRFRADADGGGISPKFYLTVE